MNITNRERYKAIAKFQRPGDLFFWDSFWEETIINWIEQGSPQELTNSNYREQFFGYGHRGRLTEIISGPGPVPYTVGQVEAHLYVPPIVPQLEPRVLEEDEHTIVMINQVGQTVKVFKNNPQKMPMYLDQPVKDWETWREYKERLDPDTPER